MSISLKWYNELWYLNRILNDFRSHQVENIADHRKTRMSALTDLQKLVDNMKRAQSITSRAATDASKHSAIMDAFEQRMDLNSENMAKIEEYEKLMATMDMGSNGGPVLDQTFQDHPTSQSIDKSYPFVDHTTGDPKK